MKKHSLLIPILAVCLLLLLTCGQAESMSTALDDAFAGEETLRLVPAELNGNDGEYGSPVGLSPDGKTVLLRFGSSFYMARDGKVIPVTFNAQRGAGDIYGKEERIKTIIRYQPSWEGFSWSADGQYAAISDVKRGLVERTPPDVAVLDTATGEIFLAATYNKNLFKEDGGIVCMNKVDRSGEYLYYFLLKNEESQAYLRFCRCPVEGGNPEILCETAYDETGLFDLTYTSNLYEMPDGSWLLSGTKGNDTRPEAQKKSRLALIRFSPSDSGWTAEVNSLGIPASVWSYARSDWSAVSGYGVFCLYNITSLTFQEIADYKEAKAAEIRELPNFVNLVRVLPGDGMTRDIWYMRKTGEDVGDVELFPAEDYLWSVKVMGEKIEPEEEQEAEKWVAEKAQAPDRPLPKEFDLPRELMGQPKLLILAACLSPDGRYALISAGTYHEGYHLYLVSLETMKVRPVDAPEGVGGTEVSFSQQGEYFKPGIIWNEDGTLLIEGEEGIYACRLETGPER